MMPTLNSTSPMLVGDPPVPPTAPADTGREADVRQREVTRVCAQTSLMLLQHGAESALAESVARRLGLALGMEAVEVALTANSLALTTIQGGRCHTTVRRSVDRGIDMHVVTEVQRTMLATEEGGLDLAGVARALDEVASARYDHRLVSLMAGLSCGAFAWLILAGRDLTLDAGTGALTFLASAVAMHVRQWLARLHFNPLVNFTASAFVATSLAAQGVLHSGWVAQPKIAMSACVLLFVPGFPLINAVSDIVKGHVNTGIARGVMALLLLLASCGGIVLAMTVWNTWTWL